MLLKNPLNNKIKVKLPRDEQIKIYIYKYTGDTITMIINPSEKVYDLMVQIRDKEHMPIEHHRIVYLGRELDKERTLSSYNIEADTTINLVLRLQGGMMHVSSGRVDYCSRINYCSTKLPYPEEEQDNNTMHLDHISVTYINPTTADKDKLTLYVHPLCKYSTLLQIFKMETDKEYVLTQSLGELKDIAINMMETLSRDAMCRLTKAMVDKM